MYKQENEMLPYLPLIQVCFPAQLMLSYSLVHRSDYDQYKCNQWYIGTKENVPGILPQYILSW